jgi:hypothetical protein
MRTLLAVTFGMVLAFAAAQTAAQAAERRMFIIQNDADGYGIDRCLANGEHCGSAAANSYCHSHAFEQAASFRKVDRDDITGAIPGAEPCSGSKCPALVAIVCTR